MDMRRQVVAAGFLLAALLLAGCTQPPEIPSNMDENSSDEDQNTGTNGVRVSGPTCVVDEQPCSSAEITEFSIPEISLSVRNTGKTPMELPLNDQLSHGKQVLVSKCPQYVVKEFQAEVTADSSVDDVTNSRSVTLDPGETLELTWFMEFRQDIDMSNRSLSCVLRFRTVFSQRLVTVKQVQVRASDHVRRKPGLTYTTTATSPVELVIESDDSVVQEEIAGDIRPLQVKSYLMNRGTGEITAAQYRNGPERIRLTASGLPTDCTDRRIEITRGDQTSRQRGLLCRVTPERIDGSQIYELRAETTYTYTRELPPVELRIGTLEAGR